MSSVGVRAARTAPTAALWAVLVGARLVGARLCTRSFAVLVLLALGLSVALGTILRAQGQLTAPDDVLGYVFGVVVPLSSFALVTLATGRARLDDSVWPLARFGLSRRYLAFGLLLGAMLAAAVLSLAAVVVALVTAYGRAPGLGADLLASAPIALLGGCCYVGWFGLGASVLRLGRGRWLPLGADFLFGAGTGVLALPWPRAHLGNLLGGEAVVGLAQTSSSALLAAGAIVLAGLAALRAGA